VPIGLHLYHHAVVIKWKSNNTDVILAMVVGARQLLLLPFAIVGICSFEDNNNFQKWWEAILGLSKVQGKMY